MQTSLQRWFAPVKQILPVRVWQLARSVATCILAPIRFSINAGHAKSSFLMRAVDKKGDPIPWYTYPAIDFLAQRDYRDKSILEFGSGQSTLWWAARAKFVLSMEEDPHWFTETSARVPSNVEIYHVAAEIEDIEKLVQSRGIKFDVIIIDGGPRRKLVALSFKYLAPQGVIILDNAEGYGFYEEIKSRECRRIDFFGFAPGVVLRHCTSMAFVNDCFLLSPEISIPEIS
jgi:hypothetical protein